MFGTRAVKSGDAQQRALTPVMNESLPRFPKPKILAIDCSENISAALRAAGYNTTCGTFGTPYRVEASNEARRITLDTVRLPGLNEQEILLVDLAGADFGAAPETPMPQGVDLMWQWAADGVITPRALAMDEYADAFRKVFEHAGMCVVFADERQVCGYFQAKTLGRSLYDERAETERDNWGFLSELARARVSNEHGTEITFETNALSRCIRRGAADAEFHCTFDIPVSQVEAWLPLAKNKYGKTVAGLYISGKEKRCLLLLPRMPAFHEIVVELLETFIAEWRPALFPHLEGAKWVHRPEYELPKITELKSEIAKTEDDAKQRVQALEANIEALQKENADRYTLLRGTGADLVLAVIRSLNCLGFEKVLNIDEEEKKNGNQSLREDIQIHDRSPVLIVDVKGVNGKPDDDEARQAEKHATMRIREWKRFDVQPLTIINHERHLPPRERDKQA